MLPNNFEPILQKQQDHFSSFYKAKQYSNHNEDISNLKHWLEPQGEDYFSRVLPIYGFELLNADEKILDFDLFYLRDGLLGLYYFWLNFHKTKKLLKKTFILDHKVSSFVPPEMQERCLESRVIEKRLVQNKKVESQVLIIILNLRLQPTNLELFWSEVKRLKENLAKSKINKIFLLPHIPEMVVRHSFGHYDQADKLKLLTELVERLRPHELVFINKIDFSDKTYQNSNFIFFNEDFLFSADNSLYHQLLINEFSFFSAQEKDSAVVFTEQLSLMHALEVSKIEKDFKFDEEVLQKNFLNHVPGFMQIFNDPKTLEHLLKKFIKCDLLK